MIWNIKHLLGIRRDFYRADSDINVWVNYLFNIDPPRKNYSQSRGKSNTCTKEIFHNLIIHSHFLLHLHLIPFFFITYISYSQIQDSKQTELSKWTRIRKRGQKNGIIYRCIRQCVCIIRLWNISFAHVFDLPFDWL